MKTGRLASVLDAVPYGRARSRRLLAEIGVTARTFDDVEGLVGALSTHHSFLFTVASFAGDSAQARQQLAKLSRLRQRNCPILLLAASSHVDLAIEALRDERDDMLLLPAEDHEIRERMLALCPAHIRSARIPVERVDRYAELPTTPPARPGRPHNLLYQRAFPVSEVVSI